MATMSSLLLPAQAELADSIKKALAEEGMEVNAGGGPNVSLAALRLMSGALARQLTGLLDIGLADVLVGAWNKAFAVRQQLEKSLKSPGKDMFLQLGEHKITSEHKPYVALMKDGHELGRLPFSVNLELVLQGAVLRILDGAIKEIQTGRVKGKGVVKCGRFMLVEKEIQPVDVPGTIPVPTATTVSAMFHARAARQAS
jgi:hypothetical protein